MYGSDVNLANVGNSRCDLGFWGVSVFTGITICSEGLAYFPSSYLSLCLVCDVGGYPVVQGMGYSQLLVFWVVRSIGKITVGVGRFFMNLGGDIVARSRNKNIKKR